MINTNMRHYDYFMYGEDNEYGQPVLSEKLGTIKMCINILSQNIQDTIHYSNCTYIGLTHEAVDNRHVIQYGTDKLKILYVNKIGRLNQVYMERM